VIVDPNRGRRTIDALRGTDTIAYNCRDSLRASEHDP
jgi:hypothetical protein